MYSSCNKLLTARSFSIVPNAKRTRATRTNNNILGSVSLIRLQAISTRFGAKKSLAQRQSTSCCHKDAGGREKKELNKPSLVDKRFWTDDLTWQRTRINTLRCLVGCTTGDFATMWYLQLNHPELNPLASTAAAMIAGISTSLALETVLLKRSMKVTYHKAFITAMGMSFVSMLTMELAENLMDWHLMGGEVAFHEPQFWLAAAVSAAAGYVVPLPYNYWRLRALGKSCH